MDLTNIKSILSEKLGDEFVIDNVDMSEYCSFRCGGKAALLVVANDMDALRYVLYVIAGADTLFPSCGGCGCRNRDTSSTASGPPSPQGEGYTECSSCMTGEGCMGCSGCMGAEGFSLRRSCHEVTDEVSAKNTIPYMIIGNGSNILVRDGGYDGIIVKLGDGFENITTEGNTLHVGAAALLSTVSKIAAKEGLTGFEFASGIPGSIGGGVFMNAGAYGGEMKDVVRSVKAISRDGMREYMLDASEMDLSYRHSIFSETGDIITEVVIELKPGNPEEIRQTMKELAEKRNAKQPLRYPSAGSFFKRPEGHFAGALIEGAGLKGLTVGGAQVSDLHAGFIINKGSATATDIIKLMKLIQNTVMDKDGVMLVPEVRIIGKDIE